MDHLQHLQGQECLDVEDQMDMQQDILGSLIQQQQLIDVMSYQLPQQQQQQQLGELPLRPLPLGTTNEDLQEQGLDNNGIIGDMIQVQPEVVEREQLMAYHEVMMQLHPDRQQAALHYLAEVPAGPEQHEDIQPIIVESDEDPCIIDYVHLTSFATRNSSDILSEDQRQLLDSIKNSFNTKGYLILKITRDSDFTNTYASTYLKMKSLHEKQVNEKARNNDFHDFNNKQVLVFKNGANNDFVGYCNTVSTSLLHVLAMSLNLEKCTSFTSCLQDDIINSISTVKSCIYKQQQSGETTTVIEDEGTDTCVFTYIFPSPSSQKLQIFTGDNKISHIQLKPDEIAIISGYSLHRLSGNQIQYCKYRYSSLDVSLLYHQHANQKFIIDMKEIFGKQFDTLHIPDYMKYNVRVADFLKSLDAGYPIHTIINPPEFSSKSRKRGASFKVNKTSKFRGVCFQSKSKKYRSEIKVAGKQYHLGLFSTEEAAARAYDRKALQMLGDTAKLNFESSMELLQQADPVGIPNPKFESVEVGTAVNKSSKYRGVSLKSNSNRYRCEIKVKGKKIHIGMFACEVEAAKAYDKKAIQLLGYEKARLNFPVDPAKRHDVQHQPDALTVPTLPQAPLHHIADPNQGQLHENAENNTSFNKKKLTSKYRGVSYAKAKRKWRCELYVNKKRIHIGHFDSEEAAARAYDEKSIELGNKIKLNFPIQTGQALQATAAADVAAAVTASVHHQSDTLQSSNDFMNGAMSSCNQVTNQTQLEAFPKEPKQVSVPVHPADLDQQLIQVQQQIAPRDFSHGSLKL